MIIIDRIKKALIAYDIRRILIACGLVIKRSTTTNKVISLINKLHPFETEKKMIRMGNNGDGGYLLPNDLEGIEACFSPGVDDMSLFEKDCYYRNIKIFLADKSVKNPQLDLNPNTYSFLKKHVGCTTNKDFITMDDWVKSTNILPESDLILQMDIDLGEYITLINMSDALIKRFRIIIIEFHSLNKLWDSDFFNIAETIFNKILQTHTPVHIHPNNYEPIAKNNGVLIPIVAEFTFLRNDRDSFKNYQTKFPHKLDSDNNKNGKHITLPQNWYKTKQNLS
jgi:hypothetical protein